MQKIRRYANVFLKNDDSDKKDASERMDVTPDPSVLRSMATDRTRNNRKSELRWQIIRNSLLGAEMEKGNQLDAHEMKCV